MGAKHTPGPWRLSGPDYPHGAVIQRRDEGGFVVEGRTPERQSADAYLIAAAPELLAALQCLINAYDTPNAAMAGPIRVAREAVSKAIGR